MNLYQNNYPYSTYVFGEYRLHSVGILNSLLTLFFILVMVYLCCYITAAREATLSEVGADNLYNDETWDSYCLKVMLLSSPPSDIDFPDVYLTSKIDIYTRTLILVGIWVHVYSIISMLVSKMVYPNNRSRLGILWANDKLSFMLTKWSHAMILLP